jgi:hypothetical protein
VRRRTKVDREEKKRPGCEKGRTVNEGGVKNDFVI